MPRCGGGFDDQVRVSEHITAALRRRPARRLTPADGETFRHSIPKRADRIDTRRVPPSSAKADYRLRIFTPRSELSFSLPAATVTTLEGSDVDELEAILGTEINREAYPAMVNVGPVWIVACVSSVDRLLSLAPDFARSAAFEGRLGVTGVTLFAATDGADIEVRSFAPSQGVNEDPVCGSCNGSIAVFRHARRLLPSGTTRYVATQGRCPGRSGRVAVQVDADGKVNLGGQCVTTVNGVIAI